LIQITTFGAQARIFGHRSALFRGRVRFFRACAIQAASQWDQGEQSFGNAIDVPDGRRVHPERLRLEQAQRPEEIARD
jgi:hypothetical protein